MARSDEARYTIRRLWPSDREAIQAHFLRLDSETRGQRFMGSLSDEATRAYARRAAAAEGLIFGSFVEGVIRGVGELRPTTTELPGLGETAEVAFAVERDFRRRGIGAALFVRLIAAARNRGVRHLCVRCLAQNRAMQSLAGKLGAELMLTGLEATGDLTLALPTPLSLWREGLEEALDLTLATAAASRSTARPVR